jgi:cysteine synthase A
MSKERRDMLRAYGAKLVLTDAKKGMLGALEEAERLHSETEGSMILGQFDNAANAYAHYMTTGPEIYEDTDGSLDIFIASIGTGGTVSGVGKYLKEKNSSIKIIGVEPSESPLITKGYSSPHKIEGIGANFIPKNYDPSVVDEIVTVSSAKAMECGRIFAQSEGILVGISSGAALAAAKKLCDSGLYKGKRIVILLPDSGDRYLSGDMYKQSKEV